MIKVFFCAIKKSKYNLNFEHECHVYTFVADIYYALSLFADTFISKVGVQKCRIQNLHTSQGVGSTDFNVELLVFTEKGHV